MLNNMAKCEDCGCSMDGGFCSNCHEEVFIAEQYSELGEQVPASIAIKANEHINNESRIEQADKIRSQESGERREKHFEMYGEYPK
jgi:hypothetical protein